MAEQAGLACPKCAALGEISPACDRCRGTGKVCRKALITSMRWVKSSALTWRHRERIKSRWMLISA